MPPVIISAAQNLSADAEAGGLEAHGDFGGVDSGVPDVGDISEK
jgi:hypothetical protein